MVDHKGGQNIRLPPTNRLNDIVSFDRFVLFFFLKSRQYRFINLLLIDLTNLLFADFTALTKNFEIICCRNELGELTNLIDFFG
jgi:hypothetical protein